MTATPTPIERAIRESLDAHPRVDFPALPGRTNHLRAGVLVPLVLGEGSESERVEVLFEERPTTMREHPGEIALPGGRMDPEDVDVRATALREAEEELGIRAPRVLGTLSSYPLYTSDYRLFPTVATVRQRTLEPNAAEVARVHRWDLRAALDAERIDGIPWDLGGEEFVCPVFDVGAWRPVFGGTAQVAYDMLVVYARALGRPLPPIVTGRYTWQSVLHPPEP